MFGNHNLVVRNLWVHGGQALLEQTREPQPLHAYDRTIVSIVTAFYPRLKAGFRAGIFADTAPPIFDLRDIHIENLDLTVHVAPQNSNDGSVVYGMTAQIDGVNVDAGADAGRRAAASTNARRSTWTAPIRWSRNSTSTSG